MNSSGRPIPVPEPAATARGARREAILVLGMHRTGTSALAGVAHLLGAQAPAQLQPGDDFNRKGYWESKAVVRLNDCILNAAGSQWRDWTAFDEDRLSPDDRARFESEAAAVIAAEYGDARLIVLKDPRMCRMAPFWLRGLDRAGIAARIAIPIRNPLEIALSLLQRDSMPVPEGLLLWLRHALDAERLTRGRVRCFVSFDRLLADWRTVAGRMSGMLDLGWPQPSPAVQGAIDDFLSSRLRHHKRSQRDLESHADATGWVLEAYDALLQLHDGAEPEDRILERLDGVHRAFGQAARAFAPVIRNREDQAAAREGEAAELGRRLEAAELERTRASEIAGRLDREIQAASARTVELGARVRTLERALTERTGELEASRADLAERTLALRAKAEEVDAIRTQSAVDLVRARVELYKAKRKAGAGPVGARAGTWLRTALTRRRTGTKRQQLEAERAGLIRASGLFDADWYLRQYQDVRDAGLDPAIHYLRHGAAEGRDPSAMFSTTAYRQRYLDVATAGINPLVHFLAFGLDEQRQFEPANRAPTPHTAGSEMRALAEGGMAAEQAKFTRRGDAYEEFEPDLLRDVQPDAKLLAFYLPQFHAIPENDRFWGRGFTEWRQIVRGLPRFPGHYQPRIPGDLGFYDLTDDSVLRRQVEMAKAAGIHGFGFYYYWFDGHRVLERPVERFLASPDIDMPFMAIWANENWTRTWDGMNGEVLLRQSYDERHETRLLADLARHFADPRYIRIAGRPFFVIYQPRHVPDAHDTFARWRARWRSEFGQDPVIFMAQTFGVEDPREFGLDGALEFPPHKLTNNFQGRPAPDAFSAGFSGRVIRYDDIVATSLHEPAPAYPLIKTIVPSWDNEARRPLRGTTLEGSTPGKYQDWLAELVRRARVKPVLGESIVCINAWNEWAEGAYLEPDLHFGAAYLNATARALLAQSPAPSPLANPGVVLVGHDALDFGAQRLLLGIGTMLTRCFGVRVQYVLLGDGPMRARYQEIAPCLVVSADAPGEASRRLLDLRHEGFSLAITNTTVTGRIVGALKDAMFRVVSLVHELPGLLRSYKLEDAAASIARHSDAVVFAGKLVQEGFEQVVGGPAARALVRPQGLYRAEIAPDPAARDRVRAQLGLPAHARIVLNVGYGDLRKGFDLFTRTARELAARRDDVYCLWVGKVAGPAPEGAGPKAAPRNGADVIAIGHQEDVSGYYAAADAFFLSSREDPYPSVVLEAMATGLPVVAFAGAAGCEDLIAAHGEIAPAADIAGAAAAILRALDAPAEAKAQAAAARIAEIRASYDFREYCFWLLRQLAPALRRVSVLVPNYNHERHLRERLESIFAQSYPVYEVVVLDDASRDGSLAAIREAATAARREIRLIANESNSGAVARQWRKGLAACAGELVWIAESDDVCRPDFVAEAAAMLERGQADFCFTDSWQIDGAGNRTGGSYIPYVDEIEPGAFASDFVMEGGEFLRRFLAVKNVILNMSGVLWRRAALAQALDSAGPDIDDFRLAADWRLYAAACLAGRKVGYRATALNGHRRHAGGVTGSLDRQRHVDEILRLQVSIARALTARGAPLPEAAVAAAERHLADAHRHLDLPMRQDLMSVRDVAICAGWGAALGVEGAVHPGDFIFRFLLSHRGFADRAGAIEYYFRDGRKSVETLRRVLWELGYEDRDPASLLEFASGYGCVTRHAAHMFPGTDWTACDIHRDAVDFVARELGVASVLSAHAPEELSAPRRYEVVFALSFFSHMPELSWGRWLKALYGLVEEGGYLIFTTHGQASAKHFGNPDIPPSGIWFKPESEQKDLDVGGQAQSIVTPEFVERAVQRELGRTLALRKLGFWWGHQDLYVVAR